VSESETYLVTLGEDAPVEVALEFESGEGCWRARVGEEVFQLRLLQIEGDGRVTAELDGEQVLLRLREDADGHVHLSADDPGSYPQTVRARSIGQVKLGAPADAVAEPAHADVRSPITGEVLGVTVAAGQRVAAGEVLLHVEAMKMEMAIRAPHDVVVEAVHVSTGDRVKAGEVLVVFKSPDGSG
jgi:biotin carboxyl carrier protein